MSYLVNGTDDNGALRKSEHATIYDAVAYVNGLVSIGTRELDVEIVKDGQVVGYYHSGEGWADFSAEAPDADASPAVRDLFDPVAYAHGLTVADVPTDLPLGGGLSVTDPTAMLADLNRKIGSTGTDFFLGVERAVQLRDALAAHQGADAA
jgi:hypothetical protein